MTQSHVHTMPTPRHQQDYHSRARALGVIYHAEDAILRVVAVLQ